MKIASSRINSGKRGASRSGGFTLAEVLAALVFMAIVIPVAMQGLRIAARAGEVAQRKAEAGRVAERLLNEIIISGHAQQAGQRGTAFEGGREYEWQLMNESWPVDALQLLTLQVIFTAQGVEHDVRLSTLWDPSTETSTGVTFQ